MKRFLKCLLAITAFLGILIAFSKGTTAEAKTVGITVTNSSLSQESITGSNTTTMTLDFAVPDDAAAGDTTTISLPNELAFSRNQTFNVTDVNGAVVATAVVDAASKTLTMTYSDYVNAHDDVTGTLNFQVKADTTVVKGDTNIPAKVQIGGTEITVGSGNIGYGVGTGDANLDFYKYGFIDYDKNEITYYININTSNASASNVVISDTLNTSGLSYIDGSFSIRTGNWYRNNNNQWALGSSSDVTANYPANVSGNSFTVNLGNITQGFTISYKVKIDRPLVNGEKILNKATATSTEKGTAAANNTIIYQTASGTASGYNYSLTIAKKDKDGNPLAGAEFTVTRKSTGEVVGTLTTDATGSATISGLLKDEYIFTETKAPDGYKLADPVTAKADNSTVTIVDEKESPATTTTEEPTTTEATTTTKATTTEEPTTTEETTSTTEEPSTTEATTEGSSTTENATTEVSNATTDGTTTAKDEKTTQAAAATTSSQSSAGKKAVKHGLPSTGSENSFALMILGLAIVSGAGVFYYRKQR
ncbi:LPXTG cell wall anchor domain-containing protein [Streptococcus devriesei]|uniref:LPXTG cell wall anchor domain-containing protein n=1 Tax=Streptococcus devriesei TaxID=231233 RepID=UPI000406393E|nr:LPXTG cell wall anchor domain-containing protein [Streptococcus devriesei]